MNARLYITRETILRTTTKIKCCCNDAKELDPHNTNKLIHKDQNNLGSVGINKLEASIQAMFAASMQAMLVSLTQIILNVLTQTA